ncbi:MAG TPA: tRNA lysidine(34) synthetase TilS, partial [Egibacteraceae bacterium]|nr:tRNA lysidine(34) synthetase TilS [Egibacteraceae bacterium]
MSALGPDGALPPGASAERLAGEARRVLDACLEPGARVLLAVSGGADSVALALLVRRARPDLDAAVLHVRHGLRDDAADAACAAEAADRLGLPFRAVEVTVDLRSGASGPEAAARSARYAAFRRTCREAGARAVLAGHTADDQAETVLLNLARGAGLPGAAGMAADRTDESGLRLVRPLLRMRRADVRAVLPEAGLRWVEDPTNLDPSQRRARARREALPALARLTGEGGDVVGALTRFAAHAGRESHALDVLAERELGRVGRRWGAVVALPVARLAAMPEGLALRVLRAAVADLGVAALPA